MQHTYRCGSESRRKWLAASEPKHWRMVSNGELNERNRRSSQPSSRSGDPGAERRGSEELDQSPRICLVITSRLFFFFPAWKRFSESGVTSQAVLHTKIDGHRNVATITLSPSPTSIGCYKENLCFTTKGHDRFRSFHRLNMLVMMRSNNPHHNHPPRTSLIFQA